MSREKVKNHEYSFDIGSNPTETVIEMCVYVYWAFNDQIFRKSKTTFMLWVLQGFFFSKRKYEYFVSNKAQKNVYLADVGFYAEQMIA